MTTLAARKQIKPKYLYEVRQCSRWPRCPGRIAVPYLPGEFDYGLFRLALEKAGWIELEGKWFCRGRMCGVDVKPDKLREYARETAIMLGEKDHE